MSTDAITTTHAYRLFTQHVCRSCPLIIHCPMLDKLINEHFKHSDASASNSDLPVSSSQHCFLCLDILHRYTSEEYIQQVTNR